MTSLAPRSNTIFLAHVVHRAPSHPGLAGRTVKWGNEPELQLHMNRISVCSKFHAAASGTMVLIGSLVFDSSVACRLSTACRAERLIEAYSEELTSSAYAQGRSHVHLPWCTCTRVKKILPLTKFKFTMYFYKISRVP